MLEPGATVGPYRLLVRLGVGGMGEVWSALAPDQVTPIALKVVLITGNEKLTERFLDEARVGLSLAHPNVVRTRDVGRQGDLDYIAMELVHGPSLALVMQACVRDGTQLPPRLVAYIGRSVARGLYHAHAEATHEGRPIGLVHRDLSPHNVLLDARGRVLLSDFGVARSEIQQHETHTNIIVGKPAYLSPEQAAERPVDARADQFSLGVVLYEAATIRRLFGRRTVMETLRAVVEETPPPIPLFMPGFPVGLWLVIQRLLEKDPAKRYETALDVAKAVEAIDVELDGARDDAAALAAWIERSFPGASFDGLAEPSPSSVEPSPPPGTTPVLPPPPWAKKGRSTVSLRPPAPGTSTRTGWPKLDLSGALELPSIGPAPRAPSSPPAPSIPPTALQAPPRASGERPKLPLGVLWIVFGGAVALVLPLVVSASFRPAREVSRAPDAALAASSAAPTPTPTSSPTPTPIVGPLPSASPSPTPLPLADGGAAGSTALAPAELLALIAADDGEGLGRALDRGTPVDYPLLGGAWSPLHEAARRDRLEAASLLLERGADPNAARGPDGVRPLHVAAAFASTPMIDLLGRRGADANALDAHGDSPLFAAVGQAAHASAASTRALLAWGARPEQVGQGGETPLIRAASTGDVACLKELLARKVRLEARADSGATALWAAALLGRVEAVRLLLAAGARADVEVKGVSARQIAVKEGHVEVVTLFGAGSE